MIRLFAVSETVVFEMPLPCSGTPVISNGIQPAANTALDGRIHCVSLSNPLGATSVRSSVPGITPRATADEEEFRPGDTESRFSAPEPGPCGDSTWSTSG